MRDFLSEVDCRSLDSEAKDLITLQIVPALLTKISEHGFDVQVSRTLEPLISWRKRHGLSTSPIFTPRFHPEATERDTVVLFLVLDGEPIGSLASRLIWCEGTLAEEFETLRFLYSDPETMAHPDLRCVVTARAARESIASCWVAHSGEGYILEQYRGGGCFKMLWRLLQVVLLTEWRWSWETGLIDERQPIGLPVNTYGFKSVEPFILRTGVDTMKRRDYLACSRRSEVREEVLRASLPELRSMAEPTTANHARARDALRR